MANAQDVTEGMTNAEWREWAQRQGADEETIDALLAWLDEGSGR